MPTQSRRRFLTNAAFAGAAGLTSLPRAFAAEGSLETTAVHLYKGENLCVAPQFVAEELLRAEGFTEIRYLDLPSGTQEHAMARGEIDIGLQYAWSFVAAIDAGERLTLLSGGMVGCVEVFAKESVRGIAEYDPEDAVRFYALRLREIGFIKSSPQKIIAEGTDWRFLDELKRELKA
jgi:NitT/TauT family transport system substrate-binding protein